MREEKVLSAIISTVPQWYICDGGQNRYRLKLNSYIQHFCSHRKLTPNLVSLLEFSRANIQAWEKQLPPIPTPSSIAKIKEEMVLKWLQLQNESIQWNKLIAYAEGLHYRTYENESVSLHLVISAGEGSTDITSDAIQKVLDPLANSQQTFIRVDKNLQFMDFEYITWGEVKESNDYKFNPDFLQPFKSDLKQDEYSFHLTHRGDIVIMNSEGLLASCRKGQWYIYDVYTFKNSIVDILGEYWVGCNTFEVVLDLSYRRHGALLIYDPEHKVLEHVVNEQSIIKDNGSSSDEVRKMFARTIGDIKMGNSDPKQRKKPLFIEIASLDGAVIYDSKQVLAFGAMIESHADVGSHLGARTTAAQSAYRWGGKPIKVSADGDITVLFTSVDKEEQRFDASIQYM